MTEENDSTITPGKDTAAEQYTQEHGPEGCDWGTQEALEHAIANGWEIRKYADPVEDARDGLSVEEAIDVMREDPSLVWLSRA